ncbi:vWA domain-containing protein [Rhodopirellula sallentina]|uniref:von Willebrand factor A n=1 Tax=Rhodopirellula sallentina SM41 TaxID=1263870 RepID=M5UJA6_9BACT|nr:VWA domain-containing protein [Rhodopirellula sallentina]EMI56103.1 von Willebrand factor A [Rhodopirellula sallentina SM41]
MNLPEPDRPNGPSTGNNEAPVAASDQHRAVILHELVRVRRQAEAARLEAKASRLDASAEQLQSLLNRIDAGEPIPAAKLAELGLDDSSIEKAATNVEPPSELTVPPRDDSSPKNLQPKNLPPSEIHTNHRFDSWDAVRVARQRSTPEVRFDAKHTSVKRPRMLAAIETQPDADSPQIIADRDSLEDPQSLGVTQSPDTTQLPGTTQSPGTTSPTASPETTDKESSYEDVASSPETDEPEIPFTTAVAEPLPPSDVQLSEDEDAPPRRRNSLAVMVSAAVHAIIFICLAGFTLSNVVPKDQVAISASVTEVSEQAMETFQIETVQPETDPSESTPDETQYEIDPMGEMAMVEVTPKVDGLTTPASPATQLFQKPQKTTTTNLKSLKSDSQKKMQFCGVEGGGNHFVYLVDSSKSMGDAFISARRALLESIDMLGAEQRFYVIFYDTKCDYMRITRADQDEPRSVYATTENKQRLKSWAMRIEMDRGKAPYEPLTYALNDLKPDVIFLLSDGEFPARIEELLQEENRVTNLFGESNPVSIIHTISYYSREGENRMRSIAENHFGQYRHVPKP